ncbi:MAG TPA: 2-amino-4-hydroxy-6-hydroxymethyldihydropteridine diphosphokinase [Candidatus Udaeobacter sp.]|jgi:2-amino-4-hydroxy-6-hydroxymethyldihydropteridine diphosphokinase|nr:2-amino-4-hydroxy-6-hydroxymethyldihydropteridine diphosphokinase [Candidatus Udaeobacter sp.]
MRTAVALGSNLGDRLDNLRVARQQICDLTDVQPPVLSSAIYETDPVDCEPAAPKFLNAVVEFGYDGDPLQLLEKLKSVEGALGRPREHARNVSRKIDIDLLYIGDTRINDRELELPHPRMYLRKFVLQPLADIRPELILPRQAKTVRELLAQLNDSCNVVRLTNDWKSQ